MSSHLSENQQCGNMRDTKNSRSKSEQQKCKAAFVRMRSSKKSASRAKSLKRLERVKGIEPSYSAWKAAALPLSYTRAFLSMISAQTLRVCRKENRYPLFRTMLADHLTRRARGLNPPRPAQKGRVPGRPREWNLEISGFALTRAPNDAERRPARPLTRGDSQPILMVPLTTKGGDPVSYLKRCHLAGIAR
jgi:hypothetical protein